MKLEPDKRFRVRSRNDSLGTIRSFDSFTEAVVFCGQYEYGQRGQFLIYDSAAEWYKAELWDGFGKVLQVRGMKQ